MLRITTLLILSATVLGFAPNSRRSHVILRMAEEDNMVSTKFEAETNASSGNKAKNLVRDVETEQKWQDTEMSANTNSELINFSSLFVLVPAVLLLNDVFHFLPKGWNII